MLMNKQSGLMKKKIGLANEQESVTKNQGGVTKKALWSVVLFYCLIAFEMAYMAGPFAVYFYGVYNPVLNYFNQSAVLSVLNSFFLPHIVRETSSALINIHEYVGAIFGIFGFISFCIGACQIYYSKFTRKGAVTGGVYNVIRHPQYTSFAVCGLGLMLLWPRVINLIMYVTMLFVYYLLARAEEKECEEKFGHTYGDYKKRTAMFFPFNFPFFKILTLPKAKGKKAMVLFCMYISALIIAFGVAKGMTAYSINSLYAIYKDSFATVSLCEIETDKLEKIIDIAVSNEIIKAMINERGKAKFINYVLPREWYAAEIPMNGIRYRAGHLSPSDYDDTEYKIIFTTADIRESTEASGKNILSNVLEREPLVEVWVDLNEQKVVQILPIPKDYIYQGVPVAAW